jgi:thioredoxin reductase (NADPH)
MPGMTGVEFLEQVQSIYPEAKRALLTAYADTEAAIRAINSAKIHYYLTKPWDPPEERLYPVLDDLLGSWREGYRAAVRGDPGHRAALVAGRPSGAGLFSRNQVPYLWLDPDQNDEALQLLAKYKLDEHKLAGVLFADGSSLVRPSQTELATKIGLHVTAERDFYDVVIVGAGLAGLAAAVYATSEGLRALLIEPDAPGGQAGSSSRIENYLGFPTGNQRRRAGQTGLYPGFAFRHGVSGPDGHRDSQRKSIPLRAARRWQRSLVPGALLAVG